MKINKLVTLVLLMSLIGALMVQSSGLFSNMIYVASPNSTTLNLNLSKNIILNASIVNSTFGSAVNGTNGNHVVNITFFWFLKGNNVPVFNVSIVNTSANTNSNGSFTNLSFNTASLPDGVYSLNVTAYNRSYIDNALGFASNVSLISFLVDNTAPNVTNVYVGNISDGVNLSAGLAAIGANYLLNLSLQVNDSVWIQSVRVNVTNSSGLAFSSYVFKGITNTTYDPSYTVDPGNSSIYVINGTFAPSIGAGTVTTGNYTPGAINVSALAEGTYTIYIDVNDTHGNRNVSTFSFTIDRTAPTITVSCTSSPVVGSTVSCTCSASDSLTGLVSGYGFPGGVLSESTTASTVGSFTSSTCAAQDFAGNKQTASGGWTTVASTSNSGGGGGGSSSGISTGVQSQFQKKIWSSINAGESASVPVKNDGLAVTEVSFAVGKTTYGAWLQVDKEDKLPSNIKPIEGKVYKNLKITESNIAKVLKGTATITFQVEKSWLSSNNINANDVVMNRYVDGKWVELTTSKGADDGTFVHYTAQTPGFSYFAIGQKSGAPTVEVKKETAAPITKKIEEPVVAPQQTAQPVEEKVIAPTAAEVKTKRALWPWIVAVLVVIALAWFFLRPRK